MRCTEKASATPSITDTTAAALRQGCWRNSRQEKLASRGQRGLLNGDVMGGLCLRRGKGAPAAYNYTFHRGCPSQG